MQKDLLSLTKAILVSIDGDDVDSITDTVESQQIVQIIRDTYELISSQLGLPEHSFLGALDEVSATYPNYLKVPSGVYDVEGIRYNIKQSGDTQDKWNGLEYKAPLDFVRYVQARDTSATNVEMIQDFNGVSLPILNDQAPTYWTSFDDEYVVCDSYDSGIDTYLKQAKNTCTAKSHPSWTETDNFTPDLDDSVFPLLLSEAKAMAHVVLRQTESAKIERQSREIKVFGQNHKHRLKGNPYDNYPNFGR